MSRLDDYEDTMEESLRFEEERCRRLDPSGQAAKILLPPKRLRQRAARAIIYDPKQHSDSPYLSIELSSKSNTLSLHSPYNFSFTLRHNANPPGNPDNKPITFRLKQASMFKENIFEKVDDINISPWMVLHHEHGQARLKEVDDNYNGPPPDFGESTDPPPDPAIPISAEGHFVSLAVNESLSRTVKYRYSNEGVILKPGENYALVFKGYIMDLWKWGSLEENQGESIAPFQDQHIPRITIAASNLVDFKVVD